MKALGLLFAWNLVYLLAIDQIAASFGNRLGFVSGGKVNAFYVGISLIAQKIKPSASFFVVVVFIVVNDVEDVEA